VGVGTYYLVTGQSISGFPLVRTIEIAAVSLGALVLLVSFFGCCGSAMESRCMLSFYFALVFLLLVGSATLTALAFTNTVGVDGWLDDGWQKLDTETKDYIQQHFVCCGFTGNDATCVDRIPKLPGCEASIKSWVEQNMKYVYIGLGVAGGIFVLGLILTCGLICGLKTKKYSHNHDHESVVLIQHA